jgi:hypothetical protein
MLDGRSGRTAWRTAVFGDAFRAQLRLSYPAFAGSPVADRCSAVLESVA